MTDKCEKYPVDKLLHSLVSAARGTKLHEKYLSHIK